MSRRARALSASVFLWPVLGLGLWLGACGGAVQSEGSSGSSGVAPTPSASTSPGPGLPPSGGTTPAPTTSASPPGQPPPPLPPPPGQPPFDVCQTFTGEMLPGSDAWAIAERLLGDGWIRFLPSSPAGAATGTAQFLPEPGQGDGMFGCSVREATYTLDTARHQVELTFPPPCSAYRIDFDSVSCPPGPNPRPRVRIWIHDFALGIDFTEGVMLHEPSRCDAAFSTCK